MSGEQRWRVKDMRQRYSARERYGAMKMPAARYASSIVAIAARGYMMRREIYYAGVKERRY